MDVKPRIKWAALVYLEIYMYSFESLLNKMLFVSMLL